MNYNVTIFGDSIAKGIVTDNGKIIKVPKNSVQIIEENYNINIDNKSVYGQTLKRLVEKNTLVDYFNNIDTSKYNVTVIFLGGNDCDFDWKKVADAPFVDHYEKSPYMEFYKMLYDTVNMLKQKSTVILCTTPPIDSKRYFENWISRVADGNEILKFFDNNIQNIYHWHESYNNLIVKVAHRTNTLLIDIRESFLRKRSSLMFLCDDGIHPNENGYRFIAESVISQLDEFIDDKKLYKVTD